MRQSRYIPTFFRVKPGGLMALFCSKFWCSFLFFFLCTSSIFSQTTGYSNVRISNAVTVNGVWSGNNSAGWVFTPTADNANIQVSEVESKLRSSSVSVTTVNSSGTQAGSIYVDDDIKAYTYNVTSRFLHLEAQGIIEVNDYIWLTTYSSYSYAYETHDLILESVGDIRVNSYISTRGNSVSYGGRLKDSGDIRLESEGIISVGNYIESSGPANTYNNRTAYGGDAGSIYIDGVGGVNIGANLSAIGGDARYDSSYDGASNNIEINTVYSSLTTDGTNDGQTSGVISGLNFTKSGNGLLQLSGSNAWTGYTDVSSGTLVMGSSGALPSNKNTIVAGVLDLKGQNYTAATFNGSGRLTSSVVGDVLLTVSNSGTFSGLLEDGAGLLSFKKTGGANFTLSGDNTYSGLTTVNTYGYLSIAHSNALGATLSGTVVSNNGTLDLSGDIAVGAESLSLTGDGYTTNKGALHNSSGSNTWSGTIDLLGSGNVYMTVADGSDLELLAANSITSSYNTPLRLYTWGDLVVKGVIAHGSGVLEKYQDGTLSLEGNNTYTGATSITNGIVKISHDNALGDVSGGTTVNNNTSLVLEGGIAVGAESLSIIGTGHDSDTGALTSLSGDNSYAGLITLSNNASIHTSSDTLTLDGSATISASSGRYLTLTGSGDLVLEGAVSIPSNGRIVLDSGSHLKMGASDVLSSTTDLEFNGGSFYTQGYNNELDQLILTQDSDLVFGTGSHSLRFAEAGAFNFRKLSVKDWSGTYGGSGVSGTSGKLYVTTDMNREKLDQISFYNSGDSKDYYALQLGSQEVVSGDDRLGTPTGYSNVRISNAVTVNGVWSGNNSAGWVFTPTADNANIQVSEVESKLRSSSVSVTTVNSSGTQAGSIYVDDDIKAYTYNVTSRFLHLEAQGIIEVNDYIWLTTYSSYSYAYETHDLILESVGDIRVNSYISTRGNSVSYGGRLKDSGDIRLESEGIISVGNYIESSGPANTYNNRTAYGGDAGSIYIDGVGGVNIGANLSAIGGDARYDSSYDGASNNIEINTGYSSLTTDGTNDGQTTGVISGLNFTKSGSGLLQLSGSNVWKGYTDVIEGALTLATVNALPNSRNIVFSGGELQTYGQNKSFGTLGLTANSTLRLDSTNHTLTFSNKGSMGAYMLTVEGWEGTYGSTGSSGTDGKLKINTTLNSTDLAKIRFYNSSDGKYYEALQLSSREIVPGVELP